MSQKENTKKIGTDRQSFIKKIVPPNLLNTRVRFTRHPEKKQIQPSTHFNQTNSSSIEQQIDTLLDSQRKLTVFRSIEHDEKHKEEGETKEQESITPHTQENIFEPIQGSPSLSSSSPHIGSYTVPQPSVCIPTHFNQHTSNQTTLLTRSEPINEKPTLTKIEQQSDQHTTMSISSPQIINPDDYHVDVIDEKTGFGWKGMGRRRILYDNLLKEYRYDVQEPTLTKEEAKIKNSLIYLFRTRADLNKAEIESDHKKTYLEQTLDSILKENHIKLQPDSRDRIFYHIFRDFIGYGPIDIIMKDDAIEDISCDGDHIPLFIYHKDYESIASNIKFKDGEELDSFVVKLSQLCGKQISVYEPIVDGKLDDGSRLQTTLARTITQRSTFTIRKFKADPLTPIDLIANNTMSVEMAAYFWMAIEQNSSILFCGGTASGKTTMLNALSLFLPSPYKIVSIEDTREINLPHPNWIAGTTRKGFSSSEAAKTGKDIDMFDLVKVALRQRPQAIIVGEVRGREAYTLFQAMTTGHLSYSTVHASNLHALIQRLESPPISLPRTLLTALDLTVFLNTVTIKGTPVRRITNVTEIIKLDPETSRLVTLTPYHWVSEKQDIFQTNRGSRILQKIKKQNGWDDHELQEELNNRIRLLNWMKDHDLRSYKQVGEIVTEYRKDPAKVLQRINNEGA